MRPLKTLNLFILTCKVDLSGVEVIEEWHHQALPKVDLHQRHCNILPALHRGHLLQHGQGTAVLHLFKGRPSSHPEKQCAFGKYMERRRRECDAWSILLGHDGGERMNIRGEDELRC